MATVRRPLVVVLAVALLAACSSDDDGGNSVSFLDAFAETNAGPDVEIDALAVDLIEELSPGDAFGGEVSFEDVQYGLSLVAIEPDSGLTRGGDFVRFVGTGFPEGCDVQFAQSSSHAVFRVSNTELTVQTPPGLPGFVDVALTCSNGRVVREDGFRYYRALEVHSVQPSEGSVEGGTPIVVTGTGFSGDARLVIGGRRALDMSILDDQTAIGLTPPGAEGPADVQITQSSGFATLRGAYTYRQAPRVDRVVPAVGPLAGGNTVRVEGVGFFAVERVYFGDATSPSHELQSDGSVLAVVPPGSAGFVDVGVRSDWGLAVAIGAYFYDDAEPADGALRLLGVLPDRGSTAGGEEVSLLATGLPDDGELTVLFGGGSAEVLEVRPDDAIALVRTPPTTSAGLVDVAASAGGVVDRIEQGFAYVDRLRVDSITPERGPDGGGTPVTVLGEGFSEGAQLFVGALPATDLRVVDARRLQAITPAGSPGWSQVRVVQLGAEAQLQDAFLYDAPFDVYGIIPDQGSVAGGTYVGLFGSGFDEASLPRIDGRPCTHVDVLDPTHIVARTPMGYAGTVDVTIERGDGEETLLTRGFTYFDPTSGMGGTWGDEIEGAVNITVVDANGLTPLADAYVMLWTDPDTPYQGWTNGFGQITFSGPDVMGEQMVSASKECYASDSVVAFDASNVTLILTYNCMSMGNPPPGIVPATISGRVMGLGKYVIPPMGRCQDKPEEEVLCRPCTVDADCAGADGGLCTELDGHGRFCTVPCAAGSLCPDGYSCRTLGAELAHCLPDVGTRAAICRATRVYPFAPESVEPGLGSETGPDGVYTINSRYGEQAVVCYGGYRDDATGQFEAVRMGVARHVQPSLDFPDVEGADVQLEIPLTRTLTLYADGAKLNNQIGPQFLYAFVFLDLRSDGVWDFESVAYTFDSESPVLLSDMPEDFVGAIYDASYTLAVGGFSQVNESDNTPLALTLRKNVRDVEDDSVLVRDGSGWRREPTGVDQDVFGLWGTGAQDLFAVGGGGLLMRYDGRSWTPQPSSAGGRRLNDIWGTASGDYAVAVGAEGSALLFDGISWSAVPYGEAVELRAVWGAGPDRVWAFGNNVALYWDGASWEPVLGVSAVDWYGAWGTSAADLWIVGARGAAQHFDGETWTRTGTGTYLRLRDVWGAASDDVFAVGESGVILHWDGEAWMRMASNTTRHLYAVWGRDGNDVYAVGARGTVLHYDGESWSEESLGEQENDLQTVWTSPTSEIVFASGIHQLVLGPLLSVPRLTSPVDGEVFGGDHIEWTLDVEPAQADFARVSIAIPTMFGDVPVWSFTAAGDVTSIPLPDFDSIAGTPGLGSGYYKLTITRVLKEGFDIDEYDYNDFDNLSWRSWSQDVITFAR